MQHQDESVNHLLAGSALCVEVLLWGGGGGRGGGAGELLNGIELVQNHRFPNDGGISMTKLQGMVWPWL